MQFGPGGLSLGLTDSASLSAFVPALFDLSSALELDPSARGDFRCRPRAFESAVELASDLRTREDWRVTELEETEASRDLPREGAEIDVVSRSF